MTEAPFGRKIRVLMVDDSEADAEIALRQLRSAGFQLESRRVDSQEGYLQQLDPSFDVILSDYHMPEFDALKALRLLQASEWDIPFIIVSGTIGEERAVAAIQSGADDYLPKDRLARLGAAVTQALERKQLRAEQEKAEKARRAAEERYRGLVEDALVGICVMQDGRFTYVNPRMAEIFGYSAGEMFGRPAAEFAHEIDRALMMENARRLLQGEVENIRYDLRGRRKDGTVIHLEAHGGRMEYGGGPAILGTLLDVTRQRILEEQLRRAQKMEALGLLAGSVAHDFNNILTVICGYAQMLLNEEAAESGNRAPLEDVLAAAKRASRLASQLLTFCRKQITQPKTVDLPAVVGRMAEMLRRVIGENIVLRADCPPGQMYVHADSGMLEQALMNLTFNARDAMPQGGRLTISAKMEAIGAAAAELHPHATAGDFALLQVSDTGCGIAPEVIPRIFEPFFTTKPAGQGNGLGLATVHSIVQQHRGWIEVESAVGTGTTFSLFLPLVAKPATQPPDAPTARRARGGTETILVVEDEAGIRCLVALVLRRWAYRVIEAESGVEALSLWREYGAETDLVITDMNLAEGMTGIELLEKLRADKPKLKTIMTSGYCAENVLDGRLLEGDVSFLPKPYLPEELVDLVRQRLDS